MEPEKGSFKLQEAFVQDVLKCAKPILGREEIFS